MAGNAFRRASPGSPLAIPARAYNAFLDVVDAQRGTEADQNRTSLPGLAQGGIVPVRNDTLATIPRYGVLGVDGPIFDPATKLDAFKQRVALAGNTPGSPEHTGRFVIALEPIAPGALGRACAMGLCIARVSFPVADGRERRYADIDDGITANLKAANAGAASILWREPGTGVLWAVVRLAGRAPQTVFPVALTQVGGIQGTAVAPATWTYDATDAITSEPLGAAIDPVAAPHQWRRPGAGQLIAATSGLAYFDAADSLVITWINEVENAAACGAS